MLSRYTTGLCEADDRNRTGTSGLATRRSPLSYVHMHTPGWTRTSVLRRRKTVLVL
jgi:hypothetical protein